MACAPYHPHPSSVQRPCIRALRLLASRELPLTRCLFHTLSTPPRQSPWTQLRPVHDCVHYVNEAHLPPRTLFTPRSTQAKPVDSFVLFMIACIMWMKLVSYHHVCWDLRAARREAGYTFLLGEGASAAAGGATSAASPGGGGQLLMSSSLRHRLVGGGAPAADGGSPGSEPDADGSSDSAASQAAGLRPGERGCPNSPAEWALLRYPENLSVANLGYFMAAPTLTYQVASVGGGCLPAR